MNIFDKYITPTEFALGLQKMCQLASMENSDALQVYAQTGHSRNRMESLLITFVNYKIIAISKRESFFSFIFS